MAIQEDDKTETVVGSHRAGVYIGLEFALVSHARRMVNNQQQEYAYRVAQLACKVVQVAHKVVQAPYKAVQIAY